MNGEENEFHQLKDLVVYRPRKNRSKIGFTIEEFLWKVGLDTEDGGSRRQYRRSNKGNTIKCKT